MINITLSVTTPLSPQKCVLTGGFTGKIEKSYLKMHGKVKSSIPSVTVMQCLGINYMVVDYYFV